MGARFYAPELGVWTSADPAVLTSPEQYVTAEFAAANPYAYANLRPVVAANRDGQFWHIAAGAVVGGVVGGLFEGARQLVTEGKITSPGRVAAAAGGGAVAGGLTMAVPAVGLASVMGVGGVTNAAGGLTTRLIESGGKSAGTLADLAVDTALGAATAGIVKGGSSLLRKVAPRKAAPATRQLRASNQLVSNPVPSRVARVVPGTQPFPTLGPPGRNDIFVTAPKDIAGMNPAQISDRLTIPKGRSFTVIEFDTPEGIASPVLRSDPGFVGGGRTAGGAREFVVPNGPTPSTASITVVKWN